MKKSIKIVNCVFYNDMICKVNTKHETEMDKIKTAFTKCELDGFVPSKATTPGNRG